MDKRGLAYSSFNIILVGNLKFDKNNDFSLSISDLFLY